MDLSNLHTSLREVNEGPQGASYRRRARHLDSIEQDLNSHFRASALELTTLYRNAVSFSKASYEEGYAHALAHVLELWDTDRDWLRGYIQRRIEAVEVQHDEDDEISANANVVDEDPAGPSMTPRKSSRVNATPLKSGSKRTRSISTDPTRKPRRAPDTTPSSSSGIPFSSSFDFALPTSLSMPRIETETQASMVKPSGPVIKISSPASSRRRIRKLNGLRSGVDRIIEIDHQHPSLRFNTNSNDMQTEDNVASSYTEDVDAWTDDEDEPDSGRKTAWTERSNTQQESNLVDDQRTLERIDRRKRRKSTRTETSPPATSM